ncbi:Glycosyltransferase GlyD [Enterococcus cecorum]|uniref:glycosyltransferase n=1 Tax=Enterococcus cecorum TaxID=44008 RepID=UPI0022D05CDE|nr:glycosyltransferase [Enterococcus cecorum]CAI3267774.1 Glycosyltransferase GlyD [Enterococcus cecorum]CAI3427922.1 Glycosyltransferase GlyD [Enterococcus cecorum]CAI3441449.1 Glycosyltransferase GlyD [Enterococcus cecorum]CAI3445273.1 Glycosyltransferase GlyD [Enterococcus cecorum]CAI3446697.1 Glycosyltransferase GlyD [Enterococcus cecorum]
MNFDHINDYSYVRLYLLRLIEADRILYLDSDIIVNGDLNPILDLALEDGAALAMTLDIKYMEAYSSILIDCARWQQYHLEEACYQIIRQKSQITNGDQNVINLACRDYAKNYRLTIIIKSAMI